MSNKERLEEDLKQAMRSRESTRVTCIRMLKSKLLEREVALRSKKGKDYRIEDDEALSVISTYAKQRRDSIDSYRRGATSAKEMGNVMKLVVPRTKGLADGKLVSQIVKELLAE